MPTTVNIAAYLSDPNGPDARAHEAAINAYFADVGILDLIGECPDYVGMPPQPCRHHPTTDDGDDMAPLVVPWFEICAACATGEAPCTHDSGDTVIWQESDGAGEVKFTYTACRDCGEVLNEEPGPAELRRRAERDASPFVDHPEGDDVRVRSLTCTDATQDAAVAALKAEGYGQSDEPVCVGGVAVGYLFVKFTPWNYSYDYVVLNIIPEYR
jgi:hypothetical protein